MSKKQYILGIDTSNYKTSVALVDRQGEIKADFRTLLRVKQGERGLRQSGALFQHVENLPGLIEKAADESRDGDICAVAYSERPRPVEGSYMPVFLAGKSTGISLAAVLAAPGYGFSHQEGHIEAIKHYSSFKEEPRFLCYHLSGGTCELLQVEGERITIIGGSKDLSFGQVIDRVGVAMGMAFPAGEAMDRYALQADKPTTGLLKKIPVDGLYLNLSGIETQCSRLALAQLKQKHPSAQLCGLIRELFDKITAALFQLTENAVQKTGIYKVLFTGGVSASTYISGKLGEQFSDQDIEIEFGRQQLSQDNAVGIALLGGKKLWP